MLLYCDRCTAGPARPSFLRSQYAADRGSQVAAQGCLDKNDVPKTLFIGDFMNESTYSEPVIQTIRGSGWFQGREVDVTTATTILERKGFRPSAAALRILRAFGGLCIRSKKGWVKFSVEDVVCVVGKDEVSVIERMIGEDVCPIGTTPCASAFVAPSGRIIWLDCDWLFFNTLTSLAECFDVLFVAGKVPEMTWLTEDQRPPGFR
jgi:hypothetical protein